MRGGDPCEVISVKGNKAQVHFPRSRQIETIDLNELQPGISFIMGISPNTGIPYACMNIPEIAKLWWFLREQFMLHDRSKIKGNKLTNIRVTINSADCKETRRTRDLGSAIHISGGTHVGGEWQKKEPEEREMQTWGKWTAVDRRDLHSVSEKFGQSWGLTFFSDFKCRYTQPYAVPMMDTVASGVLL